MLHVIDGTRVPNQEDRRNGIKPGFGATVNIINGGLECNTEDGRESNQARNRIKYYKQFAWYLYVDYEGEELGCAGQQQFSAGGLELFLSTGTRTGQLLTHASWSTIRLLTVPWSAGSMSAV